MAFFKFRKGGDEPSPPPQAPESVQAMRQRARHRLVGAAVLVLAGVIGFPILFDSQPRPIAVDIPIEIPDKNKVKPLGNLPVAALAAQTAGVIEEGQTPPSVPAPKVAASEPVKAVAKPEIKPEPKAEAKPAAKPVEKAADKSVETVISKPDDGAKARALLEGRDEAQKPAAAAGRFVVQVGAYSDVLKAREARAKLEKSGLKTYTQVIESKEGKRIRVRVGPFESKGDADKVAEKIKKLDLAAAILEL